MANEEYLKILEKGLDFWNTWKKGKTNNVIDLSNADLSNRVDLEKIDFSGVDLRRANLSHSFLRESNFQGAVLSDADLTGTHLNEANFSFASLECTNLIGAQLNRARFDGADLTKANLSHTHLSGAFFSQTTLHGTIFNKANLGATTFAELDLREAIGIEDFNHYSSSFIATSTIHLSKGIIPEVFMRGCGLSDLDIEYTKLANPELDPEQVTNITNKIHQLYLGNIIQYYSCFISYSSKDHEFAQRIHNDLQNNGVRCWFDREDIKIGDAIRPTIDRQIRLRDKLLVILSENSIQSEYVGDEVEAALEEEQKNKRLVVFPIRLDDTPLNTRDDWAAKIKRRRHIGDFSNWKDETSYKKAFEKLLRDLKSVEG